MKELLARIRASFENLNRRERLLVVGAGGAILAFVLVLAVVQPLLSAAARASARAVSAEQELEVVRELRRQYDAVNARLGTVEARIQEGPKAEIFTTLEGLATQAAVKVDSMDPRTSPASEDFAETKVQVSLKGITLSQLVNYLHRIESAEQLLSIKSLRIRTRSDKQELLDVTFTVSSFEPA